MKQERKIYLAMSFPKMLVIKQGELMNTKSQQKFGNKVIAECRII